MWCWAPKWAPDDVDFALMGRRSDIPEGIQECHKSSCAAHALTKAMRDGLAVSGKRGPRCTCQPTYRASVAYGTRGKRERQTFATLGQAVYWRRNKTKLVKDNRLDSPTRLTVRNAGEQLLSGMRTGAVRTKSGGEYAGSVIASYESSLQSHLYPLVGARQLADLKRHDIQQVVEHLNSIGKSPSTINNTLNPLRVMYRHAIRRGEISENPTLNLELPAIRGRRDRVATPIEISQLIAAIDSKRDRLYWGIAFYAGLRVGEILALTWGDVDTEITVRRSWCDKTRAFKEPKTRAGVREVPIIGPLRALLTEYATEVEIPDTNNLLFATANGTPLDQRRFQARADATWQAAGLPRYTAHECRHTMASVFAASNVPIADLCIYMGHATISITMDRYRHMYPEARENAAKLVSAFIARDPVPEA
jgi:integrase